MRDMTQRPLWECPRCGNLFVTPNMWHSCVRVSLDRHFAGKDPAVRALYEKFLAMARKHGEVRVVVQKTRISFQVRVRFGGCSTRKNWLQAGLWLTRRAEHPRLTRVEKLNPRDHVHYFRIERLADLDAAFAALVREAYAVGRQEHLEGK